MYYNNIYVYYALCYKIFKFVDCYGIQVFVENTVILVFIYALPLYSVSRIVTLLIVHRKT